MQVDAIFVVEDHIPRKFFIEELFSSCYFAAGWETASGGITTGVERKPQASNPSVCS
jgi:hypothetical protein